MQMYLSIQRFGGEGHSNGKTRQTTARHQGDSPALPSIEGFPEQLL